MLVMSHLGKIYRICFDFVCCINSSVHVYLDTNVLVLCLLKLKNSNIVFGIKEMESVDK